MSRSSSGYGVVGWATIDPVGVGAAEPMTIVRPALAPGAVGVAGADEEVEREEAVDPGGVGSVGHRRAVRRDAQVADDRAGLLRQPGLVEAAHGAPAEHRRRAEDLADGDDARAADPGQADDELVGRHRWHGVGQAIGRIPRPARHHGPASPACSPLASTDTRANDGQSPSRHVMSKLQLVWWMRVLRPYSVITGCTDRQLLLSPQSPHPSQTRSLITMRKSGLASLPRLRARRFSAAHAWSWTRTVTPADGGELLLGLDQPACDPRRRRGRRAGRSRRRGRPPCCRW